MSDISQHFRLDEADFVQQAQQWVEQAVNEYRQVLTPFLNPRERYILQVLINRDTGLKLISNGLFDDAEMQRSLILPDYIDASVVVLDDFELQLVEIKYPKKFLSLQHRMILGAFMHNGIERDHIGDIVTNTDASWQFVTTPVVAQFIVQQIEQLGRAHVQFVLVDAKRAIQSDVTWESEDILTASNRLDTVVANAYHVSRSEAKALVEAGSVKVNWGVQERPDAQVSTGDLISVRGYGRMQLIADNGLTKKDKHKLTISRLIK